jgi:plasmid stability protein
MPILHVRDVPDDLYARLKRRAEAQRRSLGAEVITLLEWAIAGCGFELVIGCPRWTIGV